MKRIPVAALFAMLAGATLPATAADADMAYVDAAFRAGASGYLLKRSAATELMEAVRSVMNDKFYVTPLITKEVVTSFLKPTQTRLATIDDLTTRQHEILQLVAEGLSAKEIADQLCVSVDTVKTHLHHIYQKLSVDGRVEAVIAYLRRQ